MNRILTKLLIGASVIFGGSVFTSCENSLEYYGPTKETINLVKSPDVIAYSGSQALGGVFNTRGLVSDEPHKNYKVQDYTLNDNFKEQNPKLYEVMTHAPAPVSDEEWEFVKNYLAEHPNEGGTVCDLTDYFIQWCGKSNVIYNGEDMKDNNGASHSVTGSQQMDYIEIDGVHLPDYNGTSGPIEYLENWPLNNPTYHDSYGDVNQIKENKYRFYYIQYNGEWGLYLCFDYATQKNSGENHVGDNVFNDWVLKITPANGIVTPPTLEDKCEECGHDSHDGNCEECEEGTVCNPKVPNPPTETPDVTIPSETTDHVEINLSIEERDGVEWLASHLSIHVRANTDVEVFIPLPSVYYCAVDDMAIVAKHEEGLMIHEGPKTTTFTINGNVVSMTVSFEDNGIRVKTNGINENVISYLNETYGDGLTFEVWNYMNLKVKDWSDPDKAHGEDILGYGQENQITVEELRGYLNDSKVWFTNNPSLYVNAFNNTEDGSKFVDDCTVTPQDYPYNNSQEGEWFNGSPYNQLYYNKDREE